MYECALPHPLCRLAFIKMYSPMLNKKLKLFLLQTKTMPILSHLVRSLTMILWQQLWQHTWYYVT